LLPYSPQQILNFSAKAGVYFTVSKTLTKEMNNNDEGIRSTFLKSATVSHPRTRRRGQHAVQSALQTVIGTATSQEASGPTAIRVLNV
jgi:hypothetical protein